MASIKGFQMKNIKPVEGIEGAGCFATLYLNGKNIGTYKDLGHGALGQVEYISKKAEMDMTKVIIAHAKNRENNLIIKLFTNNPEAFERECKRFKEYHPYIPDEDITIKTMASNSIEYIVEDFLELLDAEKLFKKYVKKGYRAISENGEDIYAYPVNWSDEKIKKHAKGAKLYMSLKDFCI